MHDRLPLEVLQPLLCIPAAQSLSTVCSRGAEFARYAAVDVPAAAVQYGRGLKRRAPVAQEFLHHMAGGDKWSILLCGHGRVCKRRAGGDERPASNGLMSCRTEYHDGI